MSSLRRVWRIVQDRWAGTAFDGEGASRFGGRWNSKGMRVVYTADSLALAALEMLVGVDPTELGARYVAIAAHIPDDLTRTVFRPEELPQNWRSHPAPQELQRRGDDWLHSAATVVLAVPSAVIPLETNFLLNPAHPDFARVKIGDPVSFEFDPRLGIGS